MERLEHFNGQPGAIGLMAIEFDMMSGHIRFDGRGFWSQEQAAAFFVDWRLIVQGIHARGAAVSALVDMSDCAVQMADVTAIIADNTCDLYRAGDAVAMLVPAGLGLMQMRRVLDPAYHQFFAARPVAEAWLWSGARHDGPRYAAGHGR